jgi:hypothetical protein
MVPSKTPREKLIERLASLKAARATWDAHYRDLANYIQPDAWAWPQDQKNNGRKKYQYIINNTATRALETYQAGMMSGASSPARPWFRLTTSDPRLAEVSANREWLDVVTERVRDVFARSNFYESLHTLYGDLGCIGTGVMFMDDDPVEGIRCYAYQAGTYVLATDAKGRCSTFMREFSMTVEQLVTDFGPENCSGSVRDAYKGNYRDKQVDVVHAVYPNEDYVPGHRHPKHMAWKSCWFERAQDAKDTGFLRESGYHENPVLAARWVARGEDVYGRGPGMTVLGDVKALQVLERDKGKVYSAIVTPPLSAPMGMMNMRALPRPGRHHLHPGRRLRCHGEAHLRGAPRGHDGGRGVHPGARAAHRSRLPRRALADARERGARQHHSY